MMKPVTWIALAFLSVSAIPSKAFDLSELVNTSDSIVTTFDRGIATVGGIRSMSDQGYIVVGAAEDAMLTYEQAEAYNQALTNVSNSIYTMSAQDWVDQETAVASQELNNAIDVFVESSSVLIQAVVVNDMASEAQDTQDAIQAQEVQSYIADNNVQITSAHVDQYNESLDQVEEAGQVYAAFVATGANEELLHTMQHDVDLAGEDFLNAATGVFDANTGDAYVNFSTSGLSLTYNFLSAYTNIQDTVDLGYNSQFYTTGPTGNEDFFNQGIDQ